MILKRKNPNVQVKEKDSKTEVELKEQAMDKGVKTKGKEKQKKLPQKSKKEVKPGSLKSKFTKRAVFFGVINLLAIVFLLIILNELPNKSKELKNLINAQIRAEASSKVNYTDLELKSNKDRIDAISRLFPDDQGLVDFIKLLEGIKAQGILTNFSFASKEPVRDKTTNLGIPVIVEFKGTWEEIDTSLQKLQSASFLFRPITVEARPNVEESVIELMYGGFLYVDESL